MTESADKTEGQQHITVYNSVGVQQCHSANSFSVFLSLSSLAIKPTARAKISHYFSCHCLSLHVMEALQFSTLMFLKKNFLAKQQNIYFMPLTYVIFYNCSSSNICIIKLPLKAPSAARKKCVREKTVLKRERIRI